MILSSKVKLAIQVGIVLAAVSLGWFVRGTIADADLAKAKEGYAAKLAQIEAAADEAKRQAAATESSWRDRIAAIDRQRIQEATSAQKQIDDLRAAVATGSRRLSVAATCSGGNSVPQGAGAAGLGNGATPVLTADSEQAYFSLRANLESGERKLAACQDVLATLLEYNP